VTVFLPTTTVTVYRGESTDEYSDPTNIDTVYATGLPVAVTSARAPRSFAHGDQRAWNPVDQRGGVVERFQIRMRPTADVREGDRLLDEREGLIYLVTDVSNPQSIVGMADVRVTAHRVAKHSQPVNG